MSEKIENIGGGDCGVEGGSNDSSCLLSLLEGAKPSFLDLIPSDTRLTPKFQSKLSGTKSVEIISDVQGKIQETWVAANDADFGRTEKTA